MSKLSIVMPIYNPDLLLFEKVLKALVVQSLKDWELIAVLDGQNDDAKNLVQRVMKKCPNHYKIIELDHGGAQRARNQGAAASTGNYLVLLDCDVILEPNTAQGWVDVLDKNPQYAFVYSGFKFLDERGAIPSEPFDPWTLRVRNYISMCFPMRRDYFPGMDESLKSLQDWSMWLSVVEKGGAGKYLPGYAFSTAYPTKESISGKGTTKEVWLERMDAVKAKHNIPIRTVCVTSINNRLDGLALAKALDADYDDHPNDKPNHYKKIIQLGVSFKPEEFEQWATSWGKDHEKVLFWGAQDVEMVYDTVSLRALEKYSAKINVLGKQYCEDQAAKEILTKAGFAVEVLPLPTVSSEKVDPLPAEPKFLVDCGEDYGHALYALEKALPDIKLEVIGGVQKLEDFTGIFCFHKDRMLRPSIKRMLASGRFVIGNCQQPFCGYSNDNISAGAFVKEAVERLRAVVNKPQNLIAVRYWTDTSRLERLKEVLAK